MVGLVVRAEAHPPHTQLENGIHPQFPSLQRVCSGKERTPSHQVNILSGFHHNQSLNHKQTIDFVWFYSLIICYAHILIQIQTQRNLYKYNLMFSQKYVSKYYFKSLLVSSSRKNGILAHYFSQKRKNNIKSLKSLSNPCTIDSGAKTWVRFVMS